MNGLLPTIGVFGLQIVEEAQPFCGEVFADYRHPQVRAALAAVFLRPGKTQVTGLVGNRACFGEQLLPFLARQTVVVPVGAGVFAAMIEEADVIVAVLDRHDLLLDELVEFIEIILKLLWNLEIHRLSPFDL